MTIGRVALALAVSTLLGIVAIGSCWLGMYPPPPPDLPARSVYLRNVTLLQPGASVDARRPARSLLIRNGRIAEIGAAQPVEGDRYAGAFVMPGLVDMHVHWPPAAIPGQTELFAFLHVYHGVTTVRSLGDNFEGASIHARDGIRSNEFLGPRVLTCGPIVDGDPPLWRGSLVVVNAQQAEAAVREIADAGFDCVKAYDELNEESVVALRQAALRAGLPIVGHTPRRVPWSIARLQDHQHLRGFQPLREAVAPPYPQFLATWREADDAHYDTIVQGSLEFGIAHTPTLVTVDRLLRSAQWSELVEEPMYGLVPRWLPDALWDAEQGLNAARTMDAADFEMVATALERMKEAVRRLHAAGVPIHSGTDTMAPAVVPGAALHRELELLVEAGLTPEQALATSVRSGPDALAIDGLGTIEVGAPADLVLLREDPTRDLAALATITGVIRDGRLYSRDVLDQQLERFRERFDGFGQRVVLTRTLRLAFGRLLPLLFADGPAQRSE